MFFGDFVFSTKVDHYDKNHHLGECVFFSKHLEQIQVFKHPGASIDTKSSSQKYVLNFAGKFSKKNQGVCFTLKSYQFQKAGVIKLPIFGRSNNAHVWSF